MTVAQLSGEDNITLSERFAKLYDEHLSGIFRYISYRIGDVAVAEDLTSVVFEKALAGFRSYKREKAAPQTWLLSIARNTLTDYFRRAARSQSVPLENADGVASSGPSPEEKVESIEEVERLRFCLARLGHQEQEIISLKFSAEITNRRIAIMLSISESNVGVILFRALRKLKDCFMEWLNGKRR